MHAICGRHLGRLIGHNSAYVKKGCSCMNYLLLARIMFRTIAGIHGIGIQVLYLGMSILVAGVSVVL